MNHKVDRNTEFHSMLQCYLLWTENFGSTLWEMHLIIWYRNMEPIYFQQVRPTSGTESHILDWQYHLPCSPKVTQVCFVERAIYGYMLWQYTGQQATKNQVWQFCKYCRFVEDILTLVCKTIVHLYRLVESSSSNGNQYFQKSMLHQMVMPSGIPEISTKEITLFFQATNCGLFQYISVSPLSIRDQTLSPLNGDLPLGQSSMAWTRKDRHYWMPASQAGECAFHEF